jgi:transcriptional regulator of aromatic amino acid metabolism
VPDPESYNLKAVPSSVLLLDHDTQVVLANRNFLEKARRSESNTIGRRLAEVFRKVIVDEGGNGNTGAGAD